MGWHFRRSVRVGPIRLNLSKSGVGVSTGVPGFRIGIRPDGKRYVQVGAGGVYNRVNLEGASCPTPTKPQSVSDIAGPGETRHVGVSAEHSSQAHRELINRLTMSHRSFRLDLACGVATLVVAVIAGYMHLGAGLAVAVLGAAATVGLAKWETRRRTVVIIYDSNDQIRSQFKLVVDATNALTNCQSVWITVTSRSIGCIHEAKRNAGASALVDRLPAQIGTGTPPWVETNIEIPSLIAGPHAFYFMPDGIFIYDVHGVGFVSYDSLTITSGSTRFIEENPPQDAQVVDKTWLHPNKGGGPDKRFASNREIPICLYGETELRHGGTPVFSLMTSQVAPAKRYEALLGERQMMPSMAVKH